MRNAGEGTPGGSAGRRQRAVAPAATARPPGNAGASLFTPAYRVRHASTVPAADTRDRTGTNAPRAGDRDYGSAPTDQAGPGYRYSELDGPEAPYLGNYEPEQVPSSWEDDDSPGGYSGEYSRAVDVGADTGGWPAFAERGDEPRSLANAIRGFPPVPDEPLPTYPPGPFAPWNRGTSDRSDVGRGTAAQVAAGFDTSRPGGGRRSRDVGPRGLTAATITPDEFDTNHSLPAIKDPVLGKESTASTGASNSRTRGSTTEPRTASRSRPDISAGDAQRGAPPSRGHAVRGRPSRSSRAARKSRHKPVWLAIGTAVVIIAAVTAVLVLTSIGKPTANTSANNKPNKPRNSASSTPTPSASKWGYIGTRLTDPTPLTVRELFPPSFYAGSVYFHIMTTQTRRSCGSALIGGGLQAAVQRAGCSQALRATYVARRDNAMATIGVFNLKSSTAASTAALQVGRSAFVAPLASKNGVSSKLGQGTGIDEAVVKGHYLVLVWAENINLTTPKTSAERQHLTSFMKTLIQLTVNSSLSYRMVEGKPTPSP
jgi:hypothetical protein